MSDKDVERRLRYTLEEIAKAAPLANPERPKPGIGMPAEARNHRIEFKTLTLVGCLLVLIGTLVFVGIEASRHGPARPVSAASTTTTSLPSPGPYAVPNVVGLTASQALDDISAAGLTNSIGLHNCPGSFMGGLVVAQNPQPGYQAASDSRVNIQISCSTKTTTLPTSTSVPS